jgi:hypothetical protein
VRAVVVIASLSASLGVVRPASADGEAPAIRWSLAAQPDGCDGRRLARATALACDALGHACVIVNDGAESDRRATLRCAANAPWALDVYDGAGVLRWTLAVEADDEGVHRAAILIARTELDVPPEAVAAKTVDTPVVTSAPVQVAPPSTNPPPASADRISTPPSTPAPWGLFAAARATTTSGFGPALGGGAGAAFVVWRELAFGFDLAGEHGLSAPSSYSYSAVRAAANVEYGAPWGPSRFGIALEGGAMLGDVTAPASQTPASQQFLHAYGRATAIVQWDGHHALRPFAALSLLANTAPVRVTSAGQDVATIPWLAASIDVGLAWRSQ